MITKPDQDYILVWAKKKRAIKYLGGECKLCGYLDWKCLVFHHMYDKKRQPKDMLRYRWSKAIIELSKCIVLCGNCHAEKHTDPKKRASFAKLLLLTWKKQDCCQECGYKGKNSGSLDFHHEGDNKDFNISSFTARRQVSFEKTIDEINKCKVLCKNCHIKKHIDMKRFSRFENLINERSEKTGEYRMPLDRKTVLDMAKEGMGVSEIGRKLGYPKSTVCIVLQKARLASF